MSQLTRRNFVKTVGLAGVTSMLAACGGKSGGGAGSAGTSGAAAESIAVCLASEPDTIDPALNSAVDGATMISHLFAGLAKWEKDGEGFKIAPDCATELPEGKDNGDGTLTYTYTLRDDLKWSDGKDLTAADFVFAWNRAAGPGLSADYNYMFDQVDGYNAMWESKETGETKKNEETGEDEPVVEFVNPDAKLNVEAKDDKTLVVVASQSSAPYWNELLAFPTYFPVREDVVANESWATDPKTYVSNGAYKMVGWDHNSVITVEKNENYHDADAITMGGVEFYLSDDANNMLSNFENGDWQLIDDVPTNEISSLKDSYPDEFKVEGQLGTYYVNWNVNLDILPEGSKLEGAEAEAARAEIRNAISKLFDRSYIINDIAQGGQVPASSFVAMGMTDADGSQFYENAGDKAKNGYVGYLDVADESLEKNFADAIETLKKYYTYDEGKKGFTDFPSMTYLYNTQESHKMIGEYLQSALAGVGIDIKLENQEWNTFLNTRKNGDYSIARNGWLADYNYPMTFLDMWTTQSGNNDVQFGKGAHASLKAYSVDTTDVGGDLKVENGTWAETYDKLIAQIKAESDTKKAYALMHKAEDLLMSTGCICPLYFYTDLFMVDKNLKGFYSTPLGFKFFKYSTLSA